MNQFKLSKVIIFTLIIHIFSGCNQSERTKHVNELTWEGRYRVGLYEILVDRYFEYKKRFGKYPKSFIELREYCPDVDDLQNPRIVKSNLQIISIDSGIDFGTRSYPLFFEASPDNDGLQLVIFQNHKIYNLKEIQFPKE